MSTDHPVEELLLLRSLFTGVGSLQVWVLLRSLFTGVGPCSSSSQHTDRPTLEPVLWKCLLPSLEYLTREAGPYRGTSLIRHTHPPKITTSPRHRATVGSWGRSVSHERGTSVDRHWNLFC